MVCDDVYVRSVVLSWPFWQQSKCFFLFTKMIYLL